MGWDGMGIIGHMSSMVLIRNESSNKQEKKQIKVHAEQLNTLPFLCAERILKIWKCNCREHFLPSRRHIWAKNFATAPWRCKYLTTAVAALHNREDQNTLTCFAFNAKREQKALILYSQRTGSCNFRVSVAIHST